MAVALRLHVVEFARCQHPLVRLWESLMCLASLSEISLKVIFRAWTFNRASSKQVTCTGRL